MSDKENVFILDPIPHEWGYVSEDNNWMAVPFDEGYMVIKNDQQIKSFKSLKTAKNYIEKQTETQKCSNKKTTRKNKKTIDDFFQ